MLRSHWSAFWFAFWRACWLACWLHFNQIVASLAQMCFESCFEQPLKPPLEIPLVTLVRFGFAFRVLNSLSSEAFPKQFCNVSRIFAQRFATDSSLGTVHFDSISWNVCRSLEGLCCKSSSKRFEGFPKPGKSYNSFSVNCSKQLSIASA